MYSQVINEMKQKQAEINEQIKELREQLKPYDEAIKALGELQNKHLHEKYKAEGKLAVQTGVCPFPDDCKHRDTCTVKSCNYDTCSNGHAYRFS